MDTAAPSWRLVGALLWPGRRAAGLLAGALLVATALPLIGPQITRAIVDGARSGDPTGTLVGLAALYLGVAVAGQAATVGTAFIASRQAWDSTNRLRERLADHALHLDLSYHGRRSPGEMIERVDGDVVALAELVVAFLLDIVASALLLAGVLVLVTLADVRIGAALVVYAVLALVVVARLQRRAVPSAAAVRETSAAVFGNLEERLDAAEDIRANGAGIHVTNRFLEVSAAFCRADVRAGRVAGGLLAATNVAVTGATVLVLAMSVVLYDRGSLTLGTAVLLFQYTLIVRRPLDRIVDQAEHVQKGLAGTSRMAELLAERSRIAAPIGGGRSLPHGPLAVEFDGVAFAYPDDDETVLEDVSLHLRPARSLGLVGRTGSGKTTIARLLLRLHDPTAGAVRIGGVDIRHVDPSELRRRVTIVTQDVQLFSSTVRDNLTLFRGHVDDNRLAEVLAEVGLDLWLRTLPHGLDTELGDAGVGLSAGEAQLLALARALLAEPAVVVLDEAASRLDPGTEALIDRAIARLLTGRTAVVIAHRLSSLGRVDEIAVVEDGRFVEHGDRAVLAADHTSRYAHLLTAARLATP